MLRHRRADRPEDFEHPAFGFFILKGVVINLVIVAENAQICGTPSHFEFEQISRDLAVMGAFREGDRASLVSETKASQDDMCGGICKRKTFGSLDFNSSYGRCRNFDRLQFCSGLRDLQRRAIVVLSIGHNDLVTRCASAKQIGAAASRQLECGLPKAVALLEGTTRLSPGIRGVWRSVETKSDRESSSLRY